MTGTLIAQSNFGSLTDLVLSSGPIVLGVLVILLAFSVFSWAIMARKYRIFREVDQQSADFYEEFQSRSSLSEIYRQCDRFPLSPLAGVFKSGYEELTHRVQAVEGDGDPAELQRLVVTRSLASLERTLRKASMAEMLELERSMPWLATTAAVAPFIGLFGTVIGVIDAFQGLGEASTSSIQAVAPGISEALVATAMGLFAAIPALVAYNHFLSRLRRLGAEMDDFSVELMNLIERSFT